MAIFDETYRVVAVESQRLTIQGVASGEIMTIVNAAPETPLTQKTIHLGNWSHSPIRRLSCRTRGRGRSWCLVDSLAWYGRFVRDGSRTPPA